MNQTKLNALEISSYLDSNVERECDNLKLLLLQKTKPMVSKVDNGVVSVQKTKIPFVPILHSASAKKKLQTLTITEQFHRMFLRSYFSFFVFLGDMRFSTSQHRDEIPQGSGIAQTNPSPRKRWADSKCQSPVERPTKCS